MPYGQSRVAIVVGTALWTMLVAGFAGAQDSAQASADSASKWHVDFGGLINAFVVNANWDVGNNLESTTRVMSGFDPSKFNAHITAPHYRGLEVSGHFQFAPSIQSNKAKFAGESFEVRIAEVDVSGTFGTFEIGRGWSIFNAQAIINDAASLPGVGRIPSPDRGGPTFGRIGTGYTWTDFDPKVAYRTPDLGGFQLRVGIFDPIETPFGASSLPDNSGGTGVGALETQTPRVEAEATYAVKSDRAAFRVWAGGLGQSLKDKGTDSTTTISGFDGGAHVDVAGFGLTAAYTTTKGVGPSGFQGNGFVCDAAGCRSAKTDFWYGGANYTLSGKTTFGASYGEGNQKAKDGFAKVKNQLGMAFIHHQLSPQLYLTLEAHKFRSKTSDVISEKYRAFIVGTQFNF